MIANKKILKEQVLKDKFLEASKNSAEIRHHNGGLYTFEMIRALRDMAEQDVYPDWRFGDTDCLVWSMFHKGS